MQIEILCNTDDGTLFSNVAVNSSSSHKWIREVPAHDGHAVIVGGGPSLIEFLPTIKHRHSLGQKIFALNGAARFLNAHGVVPDYQVILDARPENISLLAKAKEYLLASQCHPSLFEHFYDSPDVSVWHPAIEGIETHLPKHDNEYALIGGGLTVGLSTMCLAYTMGYRKLHLFGYDSSHRQTLGHAYNQPMNNNDVLCKVTLDGETFTSSLAMARQAELFPAVCNNLLDRECIITLDSDGLIMAVYRNMRANPAPKTEADKYKAMWNFPEYRTMSPGELAAQEAIKVAKIDQNTVVIDFGCGTGRGGQQIHNLTGAKVFLVDFADNAVSASIRLPFFVADLTRAMTLRGDVGYCTDVMEHIPTHQVNDVIKNVMDCVDSAYFQISLVPDAMGELIGMPLHLSVYPHSWWVKKFSAYEIVWTDSNDENAAFYVQHRRV
ncbi:MAG: 6-hydroxymethylpterin diphosphokinase MptE-like protein [Betaproteobacteria bacterium]